MSCGCHSGEAGSLLNVMRCHRLHVKPFATTMMVYLNLQLILQFWSRSQSHHRLEISTTNHVGSTTVGYSLKLSARHGHTQSLLVVKTLRTPLTPVRNYLYRLVVSGHSTGAVCHSSHYLVMMIPSTLTTATTTEALALSSQRSPAYRA